MAISRRDQALLIARNQRIAETRQRIFAGLESGEIPMEAIMDKRLPLTEQERQNAWNQMAANQWSGRQAALRGESQSSSGQPDIFSGTSNQLAASLNILTRSPEWQTADEKTRTSILQRQFGTQIAQRYANSVLEREAIAKEQRQDVASEFDTRRTMERERRQSAARLASTEPEMLHRNLMSGDWTVSSNGVFQKNPEYNPSNPLTQNLPPYLPLSSSGEATIARHWDDVMPGRPNPLGPEKLMRIRVAEENPDLSAEDIVKTAQARLATIAQARANPAGAIANIDEQSALSRIAAFRESIPTTGTAPQYNVERSSPLSVATTPITPTSTTPRFGQQLRQFGANAARDIAGLGPQIESRIENLGRFIERGGYRPELGQFLGDLFGQQTSPLPSMPTPLPVRETESFRTLPDWLK